MSLVLATSSSVWQKKSGTLTASSSLVVDTFGETTFLGYDCFVVMTNGANSLTKTLKLSAHKVSGATRDQVYSRFGDSINVGISAGISSGNFELTLTNNEAFDVDFSLARIKT